MDKHSNIHEILKVCDCCYQSLPVSHIGYQCNKCGNSYDLCEPCKLDNSKTNCPPRYGCNTEKCAACGRKLPLTRSQMICKSCYDLYTVCPLCVDKSKNNCPQNYGCNVGAE